MPSSSKKNINSNSSKLKKSRPIAKKDRTENKPLLLNAKGKHDDSDT
jgi:hypothetical protein